LLSREPFDRDQPKLSAAAADLHSILIFRRIVPARDRLETRKFQNGYATRRRTIALEQYIVLAPREISRAIFRKDVRRELRIFFLYRLGSCRRGPFDEDEGRSVLLRD
jgi:hypothetical protein